MARIPKIMLETNPPGSWRKPSEIMQRNSKIFRKIFPRVLDKKLRKSRGKKTQDHAGNESPGILEKTKQNHAKK